MQSKIKEFEWVYRRPNCRYAKLSNGEYVLLELEFKDGTFITTPEYHHYMNWSLRETETLEDKWETPPSVKSGGSNFTFDESDPPSMLDPMNIENYATGKWKLGK